MSRYSVLIVSLYLLVGVTGVGIDSAAAARYPLIVAKTIETSVGNFVIYVPTSNGNFRATVYLESSSGNLQTCANMAWFDDNNNPQTSANVCSDNSEKGGFV